MSDIIIREPKDGLAIVEKEDTEYTIIQDDATGDWQVVYHSGPQIHSQWMKTKGDGIKYVLGLIGIIQNADYNHAPDRTSA